MAWVVGKVMYGKSSKQYQHVQVSTVDRGRLLLMMYDGGLKFLKQAKDGLENKDISKFAKFLSKSQAIIAELMNTLDHEAGGKIAMDLERLYDFMLFYLTEANLEKSPEKIERVINLLTTVANAYRTVIESEQYKTELAGKTDTVGPTQSKAPTPASSSSTKTSVDDSLPGSTLRVSL